MNKRERKRERENESEWTRAMREWEKTREVNHRKKRGQFCAWIWTEETQQLLLDRSFFEKDNDYKHSGTMRWHFITLEHFFLSFIFFSNLFFSRQCNPTNFSVNQHLHLFDHHHIYFQVIYNLNWVCSMLLLNNHFPMHRIHLLLRIRPWNPNWNVSSEFIRQTFYFYVWT